MRSGNRLQPAQRLCYPQFWHHRTVWSNKLRGGNSVNTRSALYSELHFISINLLVVVMLSTRFPTVGTILKILGAGSLSTFRNKTNNSLQDARFKSPIQQGVEGITLPLFITFSPNPLRTLCIAIERTCTIREQM